MLSQYDYHIEFKSTKHHLNADMLSRLPLPMESKNPEENNIYSIQIGYMPRTVHQIRLETQNDEILGNVLTHLKNDRWPTNENYKAYDKEELSLEDNIILWGLLEELSLEDNIILWGLREELSLEDNIILWGLREELSLEDNIILWGLREIVPRSLRCKVLDELHAQHPGIVRMKALSRIHIWYTGIDKDIENIVKQCDDCSRVANEPPKSVPHPWDWPTEPMDRIHIDYFHYEGKMFLIMVDSYSKWMGIDIMPNTNSANTIRSLERWFTIYGLPNQLVTDNVIKHIKHIYTPVYHQSTNGQVERYVQIVKKGLKVDKFEKGDIQNKLNKLLTSFRSTPTVTGLTHQCYFWEDK